jgi:hypothetical protein
MAKSVFHVSAIGGRPFEAVLSADGPYIDCGLDGVALGACTSIELLDTPIESARRQEHGAPNTWWIAKYGNQPRISLDGMSESQRQQLADEFGIRIGRYSADGEPFWTSPAFRSLADWVKVHPRVVARFRASNAYLPGWYDAACARGGASNSVARTSLTERSFNNVT